MTSEKGVAPGTALTAWPIVTKLYHVGEQNAGRMDINNTDPHNPIEGGSSSTSGRVYAHDRSADRGIPHHTPRPVNTTAAPTPYPGRGPPAHDRPGMQRNVVVMQQPRPRLIPHPDPMLEAEYTTWLKLSICLCCFCSWILGIVAIIFWIKARKAARFGLMDDAESYAMCAKGWNVATVTVYVIVVIVTVLVVIIRIAVS